jgi:drug/metabolite transporter (DMT)-like permease
MLLAALCFSAMSAFAKEATRTLPSQQVVLVRASITLLLSLAIVWHRGLALRGNRPGLLVARGVFGTISLSCYYLSLAELPLADATIIQHTSPVLTALLAAAVLGERVTGRVLLATVAALAGVALMVRPGAGGHALPLVPSLLALLGAFAAAAVYVTVRRLRAHDDAHVIVLYFPLVAVPASLPLALPVWRAPDAREWMLLAGVGVTTQLAQLFMTRGLALESAARATSMNYMQIVFNLLLGVALFAEWPTAGTVLGALIVVGSTIALAWGRAAPPSPATPAG